MTKKEFKKSMKEAATGNLTKAEKYIEAVNIMYDALYDLGYHKGLKIFDYEIDTKDIFNKDAIDG